MSEGLCRVSIDNHFGTIMVAIMKSITIKGIPDELHKRLKAEAKRNRRSLNQEVIARLRTGRELGSPAL